MAAILEIESKPAGEFSCAMVHISIDGKEYMLVGSRHSVTVIAGKLWISSRRTLGKTFHKPADLLAHYKKHADILLEYANKVTNWGRTELRLVCA